MKITALNNIHKSQNAKMIEFAGYEMPIQYENGMLKEHEWVRSDNVGLFDVSHMGQITLTGNNIPEFLSKITPSNFKIAKDMVAKYTVLTNEDGGIIDDLIITKLSDEKFFIVINAGCKEKDIAWMLRYIPNDIKLERLDDRSLIAVQGKAAQDVLQKYIIDDICHLPYMNICDAKLKTGESIYITRAGYTGEDGYEISISNDIVSKFWLELCDDDRVQPIGLGARDSLRLEMGYPLYGHDLNDDITPIEAGLGWVVSKSNDNFFGSDIIKSQKENIVKKRRVGVKLLEKGIAREGCILEKDGIEIGKLTSGGFSPILQISIGQAYISSEIEIGTEIDVIVRNRKIKSIITNFTFLDARTKSLSRS